MEEMDGKTIGAQQDAAIAVRTEVPTTPSTQSLIVPTFDKHFFFLFALSCSVISLQMPWKMCKPPKVGRGGDNGGTDAAPDMNEVWLVIADRTDYAV